MRLLLGEPSLKRLLGRAAGCVRACDSLPSCTLQLQVCWAGQVAVMAAPSMLWLRIRRCSGMVTYPAPWSAGCASVIDTGETAYAMVLADDLDGDGLLELLLATMGGNLFAFGTHADAQPLAFWQSQARQWGLQRLAAAPQAGRLCLS